MESVSVFGPSLSTPEDGQAKGNPLSLHSDKSNTGTDRTKSRLEAILGPGFYLEPESTDRTKSRLEAILGPEFYSEPESTVALENGQLDLSPPKSSPWVDNRLNTRGSICGSETCQHLKTTTFSSVSTSARLSPGSSSGGFVTPGCQIGDEIMDDSTPVEELVSSLEDLCNEASDTTQLIPVIQRVGALQRRVRISKAEEGLSPSPFHSPAEPAGQDLSQIEKRLKDLTERVVASDAFQTEVMLQLGRISDEIHCSHKFQMQVHQRVVPRIILCSKRKGTRQKILRTLTPGVKSVLLHMLCEQEGEEHKVDDAPGCPLHLKEGESWEAIYPFLNHGLRVLDSVTNVAMRFSGVGGNVVPSPHARLQQFNATIVQPNGSYDTSQTPQAAAAQAAARKGAEQWLVKHLKGRDKMQDFGLQRMVFEKPGGSQVEGTIVWLCKEHAEKGKDSHLLTNLPT